MANNTDSNRCWYCGKEIDTDEYNVKVPMYKEVSRHDATTVRSVDYKTVEVSIPVCKSCNKHHKRLGILSNIVFACVVIGVIATLVYTEGNMWWLTVLIGIGLIAIYCIILNLFLNNRAKNTGIKNDLDGHPLIETMKKDGWSREKPQA